MPVPTDKSIPPPIKAKVMPTASTPFIMVASRIPFMFFHVKKFGAIVAKIKNITANARNMNTICFVPEFKFFFTWFCSFTELDWLLKIELPLD